jgi:large subunit ribosomal protein L9
MEVILLEKVHQLGSLGDRVKVRPGYGRNYLIPMGKAVPATAQNVAKFEVVRAEFERTQAETLEQAKAKAAALGTLTVTIASKAGTEGRLYGSVGTADIASAVTAGGVTIAKSEVRLPQGPLREVGEHVVNLHLHADVDVMIKVIIIPE